MAQPIPDVLWTELAVGGTFVAVSPLSPDELCSRVRGRLSGLDYDQAILTPSGLALGGVVTDSFVTIAAIAPGKPGLFNFTATWQANCAPHEGGSMLTGIVSAPPSTQQLLRVWMQLLRVLVVTSLLGSLATALGGSVSPILLVVAAGSIVTLLVSAAGLEAAGRQVRSTFSLVRDEVAALVHATDAGFWT